MRKTIWLAGLLVASLGCALTTLLENATPVETEAVNTATTGADGDQKLAMREGFEGDVDAFIDGTHYWLRLTIQEKPFLLAGHQRVLYVNTSPDTLKDVVFRLYVNALADRSLQKVSNVTVDGKGVTPEMTASDSILTVPLGKELHTGESVEIEMDFTLELPTSFKASYGRMSNRGGVAALSSFYPMLSVYEKGAWWDETISPLGDPAYSEVALYDVTVIAPSEMKLASTGVIIRETQTENGMVERVIVTGPVRDFSMSLSRKFDLISAEHNGLTVNIWSLPGKAQEDQFALDETGQAIEVYDEQFGQYPFAELDIVEAPIEAAGIEYPQLIYMASDIWDVKQQFFRVVIAHEVGHEWWYSMVGNDQINQPWLDEALADFSVIVYYREIQGPESGQFVRDFYQQTVDEYLREVENRALPVGLPVSAYTPRQYGAFVYDYGALFYSHLEDEYGEDRVIELLRAYYQKYRYEVAHSEDMGQMVESLFGPDGRDWFDEVVYGK